MTLLFISLRDNRDLNVVRQTQNLRNETPSGKEFEMPGTRTREKNWSDLLPVGEPHQGESCIRAMKYSRLNMEIPSEVQMLTQSFHKQSVANTRFCNEVLWTSGIRFKFVPQLAHEYAQVL